MSHSSKSNAGRPTVLTPKVVSQLVLLLSCGLTVREACLESEISHEAYYSRARSDERFADKMAKAQGTVTTSAKILIAIKVRDGDANMAKWWLDRLDKQELARAQMQSTDSNAINTENDPGTEPTTLEDMIKAYEGYQHLTALKYKEKLVAKIYLLPKEERNDARNKLYGLSYKEICELAIAEYSDSLK